MLNNNRGIYVTANTSINNGANTRVRGFHVGSQGGSGTIHVSNPQPSETGTDFRMWICVSAFEGVTLPEGGVRFPHGVSVSIPTSIALTLFIDP